MMHNNPHEVQRERAILVGLNNSDLIDSTTDATLDELEALLETAGGDAVLRVIQNKATIDPRTLIGEGKVAEIKELCELHEVDLVVFDNQLSPSQTRCLEKDTGVRVIDRNLLILDIFADRARTHEGRIQVEMAQYKYILPRLSGLGLSLSRQGGGIGTRRGPGESKLETDRRHIRRRLEKLGEELADIRRIRTLHRDRRGKNEMPVVSLIGYTNAGKSTLFNLLTTSDIPARNRLFDTLDTTVRRFPLTPGTEMLLTDTVGFIRRLPHHLVEAFRATLDELQYANLLLHVIDVSNPEWAEQAAVVDALVADLGASDTPCLRVYNKADLLSPDLLLFDREGIVVSSITALGIDVLRERILAMVDAGTRHVSLLIPYAEASKLELLYREAHVETVDYQETGIAVEAVCDGRVYGRVRGFDLNPPEVSVNPW